MAKVLLADDSVTIHKVVEIILAARGYDVLAVDNGREALDVAGSFRPDVLLADIDMPGLNGYDLATQLKQNPDTKDVAVLLLAGAFDHVDQSRARKAGAVGSLVKPFESDELLNKLEKVLGSKAEKPAEEAEEAEVLEVEGLEQPAEEIDEEGEVLEEVTLAGEGEEAFDLGLEAVDEGPELTPVEEEGIAFEGEEFAEPEEELAPVEAAEAEPAWAESAKQQAPSGPTASPEAIADAIGDAVREQLPNFLSGADIKAALLEAMSEKIEETVEKVLWEIVPELTEKLTKTALDDSMKTLAKEIQTVIWEIIPEIAENIIKKEIERIRKES